MFNDVNTWVAMAGAPIIVSLFRILAKVKREIDSDISQLKNTHERDNVVLREALSDFKLHVARNYVSVNYLKDVESRLTNHLLRIEKKLDEVGRK